VLATAGAAEAFTLVARWRPWVRPVVVHPQFTEPHSALLAAGADVAAVVLPDFRLDPDLVPEDADLVVMGNPTNPTGVLHPATAVRRLLRPGRVVLVDEAFMDAVPGELESLAAGPAVDGLLVARSLTKLWGIPGVRVGYLLGDGASIDDLRRLQTPWSVSAPAIAAMVACSTDQAAAEAARRAAEMLRWRDHLELGLDDLGVERVPSSASFVLARVGRGVHATLREHGIAVRRADTFPGLDDAWVRIAVRPEPRTDHLVGALSALLTRMP
jgi:histidinol-phosphate/aromatic aminotransferase/cobyric acid decarboxylase-like protein